MSSRVTARLQLLTAAVLFSTGGAAIKAVTFTGWQIAGLRSGVAAVAILVLSRQARQSGGWTWRALLAGVAYAICLTLFVLANRLTTAANTIYLQSTAPLYLLVLSPWLLKEPIRRQDVGFMAIIALGLALFFIGVDQPVMSAPDPARGNLIAVVGGFFWALTVCALRWMGSAGELRGSAVAAVAIGNILAFLLALPMAGPVGSHAPRDWVIILFLGIFQIAVAYLLVTAALRSISAFEASLILLLEPALNPVWAWVFQGEQPGPWALAGGVLILGTTTFKAMWDARGSAVRGEVGA
jgi:drug/metabolite transporter, DME family